MRTEVGREDRGNGESWKEEEREIRREGERKEIER